MSDRAIIVTHLGPCYVNNETAKEIESRTEIPKFWSQILFRLHLPDPKVLEIKLLDGKIPEINSFEEFEKKFIMEDPPFPLPPNRNIVL